MENIYDKFCSCGQKVTIVKILNWGVALSKCPADNQYFLQVSDERDAYPLQHLENKYAEKLLSLTEMEAHDVTRLIFSKDCNTLLLTQFYEALSS